MTGTNPSSSLSARAHHEAGHFIAAKVLGLNFFANWITIETREHTGGSCGFTFLNDISPPQLVQYRLAGIVAELCADGSFENGISDERISRLFISGHDDLSGITQPELHAHFGETASLVRDNWDDCARIAGELLTETTLFGQEAFVVLRVKSDATYQAILDNYRIFRRDVKPPPEWRHGETPEKPAGPYYEDFRTWWDRDGWRRNGETMGEWLARLLAR